MYYVSITCEKSGTGLKQCHSLWWETNELAAPIPDHISAKMAEGGWIEQAGKHYCPKHDPAEQGEILQVSLSYREIAPGVRVRWPGAAQEGDSYPLEVHRSAPADVRAAVETLKQQREEDGGVGAYDMVDQSQITVLIDYLSGL